MDAATIIKTLDMQILPDEGGYFSIKYRSEDNIPAGVLEHAGPRCLYGTIYYLETKDQFSAMHQLPIDEVYYFHMGDPLEMLILNPDGKSEVRYLGLDILGNEEPQIRVPKNAIHGSRPITTGDQGFSLISTSMSPGFEDRDPVFPSQKELTQDYPDFSTLIHSLTR